MMAWPLLVLIFCIADLQTNGFNLGPIVHALLTNVYLAKFFYWETGYFNTLDITMDRAGYYLCWGCLCWVEVRFYEVIFSLKQPKILNVFQASFTNTAYFMVSQPSLVSSMEAIIICIYGLFCTYVEYQVDHQKEVFRATKGKCEVWGKPAEFIVSTFPGLITNQRWSKMESNKFGIDFY